MKESLVVREAEENMRLDVFLHKHLEGLSRTQVKDMIKSEMVQVNGLLTKPSHSVCAGDRVDVEIRERQAREVTPDDVPLAIIYEDEELLVVNKMAGMVVHPVKFTQRNTLVNALLNYTDRLSAVNGPLRRGIVHRLDKDTSGVLVVARTDSTHRCLAGQFKERLVKKRYKVLVQGKVERAEGVIEKPVRRNRERSAVSYLAGKKAVTRYSVCKRLHARGFPFTLLDVHLETGRTHQIRVHFASIGHPVAGDRIYGKKSAGLEIKRQALHAELIGFFHPVNAKYMEFRAPLPHDMEAQIDALEYAA